MLPDQQWESEKTKRQKRLIGILCSILAALFLAGFILAATNSGKKMTPKDMPPGEKAESKISEVNEQTGQPSKNTDESTDTDTDTQPQLNQQDVDPTLIEDSIQKEPSPTKVETEIENSVPDGTAPKPPLETETEIETTDNPPQQSPLVPSPFRNPTTETPSDVTPEPSKKQNGVGMVAKIDNRIGDLAGLLEKSGASLSDLRDVAFEASKQSFAGIPKYVVEKPNPVKSDLEDLKLNVGGMLFDQTPLPVVVRDLISISGVPITIDARTLQAAGKDINQPISMTIKDMDLDSAINRILVPVGITKQPDSFGLKLTVASSPELKPVSYSLADFGELDEQARQNFVAYIQAMIEPQIWVRDQNPATLLLQGDSIEANCPDDSHIQIKRLITKLKAAKALVANPDDPAAIAQTLTLSGSIVSKLESPIETKQTIRSPIGSYLNRLQSKTGVTVLVDWENVSKQGWNPQTFVPGNIDEPTTGDLIKQLAQSMGLSVIVINQETLMLTTIQEAANARDIEVYPVAKLLAGKFDEQHLKEAFETTLGYQLRTEKYVYNSTCQCFIVAAPQSKQRQVEALLKRLEGI